MTIPSAFLLLLITQGAALAAAPDGRLSTDALAARPAAFFPGAEEATLRAYRPLAMLRQTAPGKSPASVRRFIEKLSHVYAAWQNDEPGMAAVFAEELAYLAAHTLAEPEDQAWFPLQVAHLIRGSLAGDKTVWASRTERDFHQEILRRIRSPLVLLISDYIERHEQVFDGVRMLRVLEGRFDRRLPFDESAFWRRRVNDDQDDAFLRDAAIRAVFGALRGAYWMLRTLPGPAIHWGMVFDTLLDRAVEGAVAQLNAYEKDAFEEGKPLASMRAPNRPSYFFAAAA